ncbi:protein transport protein Sec1p [Trichomonascus vanleenenianus]|uniref:Sec1p n=1 Tax=Trichomonascus vanleenenianus TaxID=2268995 RepID=UPI003EC9AA08
MSLIEALRQRVFEAIDSVQPPSRYKVLVIDEHVKRIFDYIFDKNELLNRQCASVEVLTSRRITQQYMEALYIMKPSPLTIDCLNADFTRVPNRYAGAHLFLLPGLTDEMHHKIRNSSAGQFIRRLDVKYFDFFPLEGQVFTFDEPWAAETFFNRNCHDLVNPELRKMVARLASVCTTLGEYPIIRFQKPLQNSYEAQLLSFMTANALQQELDKYAREHPEYPPVQENRPRATMLIVDRSVDPIAPLLHEFTYQAMAYDLLDIVDTNKYKYQSERGSGTEEAQGVLSDKDAEWVALRHLHMQEAIDTLTQKLEKFKKENPHLVDQSKQATVTDLQDMIATLPMFAEMKERFALHLAMADACMDKFQKKNLNAVANIEQTCATGVGPDGKRNKHLTDDLVELLADPEGTLGPLDKVRLIALYALYRGGLIEADFKKLQKHCGLEEFEVQMIRNMGVIGSQTFKETPKGKPNKDMLARRFHGAASGDVFETSRFVPGLKNIVSQLIQGTLDAQMFPYTKDEPVANELEHHNSLRNPRQRAAWAKTTAASQVKQRVFVFVIGGATQSEVRSMYELSQQLNREVIIGGTAILTPTLYLMNMGRLTVPRDRLKLPIDRPPQKAPAHLFESDRQTRQANQAVPAQKPSPNAPQPPAKSSTPLDAMNVPKKEKKSKLKKFFK